MAKRIGVVVGRFQVPELHEGHKALLDIVSQSMCDYLIVVLGASVLPCSYRDPIPVNWRAKNIYEYLDNFPHTILNLQDCANDAVWSSNLDDLLAFMTEPEDTVTIICGRDSIGSSYTGKYPVFNLMDLKPFIDKDDDKSHLAYNEYLFSTQSLKALFNSNISGTVIRRANTNCKSIKDWPSFNKGIIHATQCRFPHVINTVDVLPYFIKFSNDPDTISPDGMKIITSDIVYWLLGRKKNENLYRFIGGFCDPDSPSIEDDALRELKEETGLIAEIEHLDLIGPFKIDDWRYRKERDKIVTIFYGCRIIADTLPEVQASDDLHEAKWFNREEVKENMIIPEHRILLKVLHEKHGSFYC